MTPLEALARRYLIEPDYHGIDGTPHRAPAATLEALLAAFGVGASGGDPPEPAPPRLEAPDGVRCHLPDWEAGDRAWGVAIQLYQLRSARNWGIGDFADLAALARLLGAAGADFVGVNPLHAMFLARPETCSPFSPSNRRFLNPLYIAVDRVPGFRAGVAPAAELAAARAGALIDYPAVARLKLAALQALWAEGAADRAALARFRTAGGEALERHARFEALSLRMAAEGHGAGWLDWPDDVSAPDAPSARRFAEAAAEEVAFHAWLQMLADDQLAAARDAAQAASMRIGLYLDLAVGEAPDGSGTWSDRRLVLPGIRIGAPPDYFNAAGQDWGIAPLSPVAMAASRAAPYRALIAEATRRAGALRIDHAMALWQLFLIPPEANPAEGAYVRYPLADMLRALADASRANRTIVIGEDLGNVPPGFREVMEAAGILSYRILLFERSDAGFLPPEAYPRLALACLSTHDLPTFEGWWRGEDVDLRAEHGLIGAEAAEAQRAARLEERRQLLADLAAAGLHDGAAEEAPSPALVVAVHRHLARAPSLLFAARLEDMAGERHPVNLPSTIDAYPNWRRRLGVPLEELEALPLFREIAAALAAERPRGRP